MRATRFLPRDSSKELTPEALDATLKSAFSSIGAPLHQNVLMFWSLLISFSQLRDVGSLSPGSCFGDVCFVFATNIAIDSTMSVGDVSLTAAKCTSEKVLRSLLASVFACMAETVARCQTASTSSQLAPWQVLQPLPLPALQAVELSRVWCHALDSDATLMQESQHESTPSHNWKLKSMTKVNSTSLCHVVLIDDSCCDCGRYSDHSNYQSWRPLNWPEH